jgi:hypothetical protein
MTEANGDDMTDRGAAVADVPITADDLRRFAVTFKNLADPEVIDQAWR